MHKERKETTHVRVGEKKTYINIYKEDKYNVCQKWSQDLKYKNNVSKKERKEKIHKILTTSLISTLPLTKCPILTLPLNMTTLIYQNYFPSLSRVTKGRVQVNISSAELASPSSSSLEASLSSPSSSSESEPTKGGEGVAL